MIPLLFLDGLLETASELNFVIRVMVFAYLLFWCYITFQDSQTLFGIMGLIAGYAVFLHGFSITLILIFFIVFIMLGGQLQMVFQMGLYPLFGVHERMQKQQMKEGEAAQVVAQKIEQGIATKEELDWFSYYNQNQGNNISSQNLYQMNMARRR